MRPESIKIKLKPHDLDVWVSFLESYIQEYTHDRSRQPADMAINLQFLYLAEALLKRFDERKAACRFLDKSREISMRLSRVEALAALNIWFRAPWYVPPAEQISIRKITDVSDKTFM